MGEWENGGNGEEESGTTFRTLRLLPVDARESLRVRTRMMSKATFRRRAGLRRVLLKVAENGMDESAKRRTGELER